MSFRRKKNQETLKKFHNLIIIEKGTVSYDQLKKFFNLPDIEAVKDFLCRVCPEEELIQYQFDNSRSEIRIEDINSYMKRIFGIHLAQKSVNWFITKKRMNRNLYYLSQILILILAALTTLSIGFDWVSRDVQLIFSVGVTFFSALLITFHFKDNWIRYSGAINQFEAELSNFKLRTGIYHDERKAVDIFLKRIQEINAEETEEWRKMMIKATLEDEIAEIRAEFRKAIEESRKYQE